MDSNTASSNPGISCGHHAQVHHALFAAYKENNKMFTNAGFQNRFASRLFWSIVALTEKDPNREQALQRAASSHQTELFFLMDSFLNAGPQAALQAYILLSPHIVTTDETGNILAHK